MDKKFLGRWVKQGSDACADAYPDLLDIRDNGIYYGSQRGGGRFTLWDVGVIEVLGPKALRISVANDARRPYSYSFDSGGALEFVDEQGCRFSYRRE